jgi:hypothetical protein
VAFSLAHPGFGPRRISAELAPEKWGGIRISEHDIWRVLCRVGLNTRGKRLGLIARHRDPYERAPSPPPPERHIEASEPGELVQTDCFLHRPAVRLPARIRAHSTPGQVVGAANYKLRALGP